MTITLTALRCVAGASLTALTAALSSTGVAAADDLNAVPPALLNTSCTADQLLAGTRVVDPIAYGAFVDHYHSEPQWLQGLIVTNLNNLMAKDPAGRQAEADKFGAMFPKYASIFRTQESQADKIAAACPSFPAQDPSVWNPI